MCSMHMGTPVFAHLNCRFEAYPSSAPTCGLALTHLQLPRLPGPQTPAEPNCWTMLTSSGDRILGLSLMFFSNILYTVLSTT